MTDVAINHISVVIKIFLENYLQALPVYVSISKNGTNSVLIMIENHTHKLITYTTFWLTSCTSTCQKKTKNSDFIENHYNMYYSIHFNEVVPYFFFVQIWIYVLPPVNMLIVLTQGTIFYCSSIYTYQNTKKRMNKNIFHFCALKVIGNNQEQVAHGPYRSTLV